MAAKTGVTLSRETLLETARRLGEAMIDALSSTAQDLLQGKPTEIDSLNGIVAELGKQHGVATPVNRTLHGGSTVLVEDVEDLCKRATSGIFQRPPSEFSGDRVHTDDAPARVS